jgi:Cys-rich four helix bundle protein (predicted Tat secretion target)
MNRRELLIGSGAVLVAAAAQAQKNKAVAPATGHEHHGGPAPLVDAAADCIKKGQSCLAHCLTLLGTGDTSMTSCAKAVSDMVAVAEALLAVATANSKHTKNLAKVAADVSRDCEAECKKHADKHAECKACMECCTKLIAESAKA